MFSVLNIVTASALAVLGFILGPLGCRILNKIPAKWLCDYNETPSEELLGGNRYKVKPTGIIMGAVLAAAMFSTAIVTGLKATLPCVMLLYAVMLLIAASDAKYTIIPDQFTIAVAVISLIFAAVDFFTGKNFITSWYSPLLGAAVGGGVLLGLDLLSTLVFKKEGFGFGDVKLMAALGLMLGLKYIIILLLLSAFAAAIHFLYLIFAGKAKKGIYLPMGPYICIGTVFTMLLQPYFEGIFKMYKMLLEMEVLP
ncbi:MAG: prepilin peptidase [Clostridia bacterium]|nr:prepilin peptidase [Clostridia bacterium]